MTAARAPVSRLVLVACLAAGPIAWNAHIVALYALASETCFAGREPLAAADNRGTWMVLVALLCAALALSLIAGLWSYRNWRVSAGLDRGTKVRRTHYLARFAMLMSVGFAIAAVFDGIAMFMLPLCAT